MGGFGTPLPPHGSVGRFDIPGKTDGVHKGGGLHAWAKALAKSCQAGEVGGQGGGDLNEVRVTVGDEFRQAQIHELAEAGAADDGVPDPRDHRNPHEETLQAGGVAFVWEGVQANIDALE